MDTGSRPYCGRIIVRLPQNQCTLYTAQYLNFDDIGFGRSKMYKKKNVVTFVCFFFMRTYSDKNRLLLFTHSPCSGKYRLFSDTVETYKNCVWFTHVSTIICSQLYASNVVKVICLFSNIYSLSRRSDTNLRNDSAQKLRLQLSRVDTRQTTVFISTSENKHCIHYR